MGSEGRATTAEELLVLLTDPNSTGLFFWDEIAFVRQGADGMMFLSDRYDGVLTNLGTINLIADGLKRLANSITQEALDDFKALREEYKRLQEENKPEPSPRNNKTSNGYVYLLRSVSGLYKIGRTTSPDNRIATFNVKLPFEVEYEHLIFVYDMRKLERRLHKRFADKQVNGEWFELSNDDVAYIKSLEGDVKDE